MVGAGMAPGAFGAGKIKVFLKNLLLRKLWFSQRQGAKAPLRRHPLFPTTPVKKNVI